ncbi:MAG: GerMN domain-containing protein [Bacillota bacterium]
MRVKRTRRSGRGGGNILAALSNPVIPVLVGLVIVLAVGYWAMNGEAPAGGDTAGQQTGAEPPTEGSAGTAPATTPGTEPQTGPKSPSTAPADAGAGDPAIRAARSRIDRSAGAAKSMLVTVYYSDGLTGGMSLQPVEINVPRTVATLKETVSQILNPPQELKLYSNVPSGTRLLGVNLKDGVAIVDLSAELESVRGTEAVNNIMASFVYSLTAIKDVQAVQLWVNGRPAQLDGREWSKPLTRADMDARNYYRVEPVIKYSGS